MTINKKYFANLITFYCIICHLSFIECFSIPSKNVNLKLKIPYTTLKSTPFDISLYDDDDANPFFNALNPLACAPGTQLILGINKYAHPFFSMIITHLPFLYRLQKYKRYMKLKYQFL